MKKPSLRSIIEGGAVVLIGVVILILVPSQVMTLPGLQTQMSPGFIPSLVAIGLIIAGLGLVLQSVLGKAEEGKVDWDRTAGLRIVVSVLLLIAYTMLFPWLGFVVTSAVFVGFFALYFGARHWLKIALLVVFTPVGVWLFFEKLFRIPLPHGILY